MMRSTMSTLSVSTARAPRTLHRGRILLGAFLLELLLFVVLIPIGVVFGMPGVPGATDFTIFFTAVPIACFAGGYAVSAWVLRRVASRRLLHAALVGVAATLLYLGIGAAQPGGLPAIMTAYGPPWFWAFNAMRIAGCVLPALRGRNRTAVGG
jgi:hypothetical protein